MHRIISLVSLPTCLVLSACFNPSATETTGEDTDADTSAGTSAGPDGSATSPSTSATTTGASTDDDTSASTNPDSGPGDTEDVDCIEDEDCNDPIAPFCNTGTCVACDQTPSPHDACATQNADTPLCDAGECVQCTAQDASACTNTTPICDTDARTCIPCTFHYQCPDSACDIAEGSCMPTDRVWTVDHTGAGDYLQLADALSQIPSGQKGTIIIREGTYPGNHTITGGRTVAIIRETTAPGLIPAGASPLFSLANATVYLQGLQMTNNSQSETIYANGTRLWIDECWFGDVEVGTSGLFAIHSHTALRLRSGADLTMRNSIMGGFDATNQTGLDVGGGSHATVLYSTLGARASNLALTCSSPGNVAVRNSILAAQANPAYSCGAAEIVSTAIRTSVTTGWFANYARGDLHLSGSGAGQFANIATWQQGDPPFDIDGHSRASVDGASEHAGADVP